MVYNETIGVCFCEYVWRKISMNYSMTLLFNNNFRIKDVAYHLGFKDEYYFSRIFKQKTGLSPTEFMNSSKEKI